MHYEKPTIKEEVVIRRELVFECALDPDDPFGDPGCGSSPSSPGS